MLTPPAAATAVHGRTAKHTLAAVPAIYVYFDPRGRGLEKLVVINIIFRPPFHPFLVRLIGTAGWGGETILLLERDVLMCHVCVCACVCCRNQFTLCGDMHVKTLATHWTSCRDITVI